MKTDVIAILQTAKDQQVAKVTELFDGMISQINALPEDPEVTALQQQVTDLTAQVNDVKAALVEEDAALATEKDNEKKLQAKLDAIKAALEG